MKTIRLIRKEHKLTMKELGEAIGVSESTISMYENGNREPDISTLSKIADYFNVSVDFLLDRSHNSLSIDKKEISPNAIVVEDEEEKDLIMCFRSITRQAKDVIMFNVHTAVMVYKKD